jgi:hypothetical protein
MRTIEHSATDKQDVRHLTDVQLARLGIRVLNMEELILQCVTCGETWSPELDSGGKLPFGYWVCPAKCNR